MSVTFSPYLAFPGTAREALSFYADVLGGTVEISTFGDFGYSDPAVAEQVMHSTFTAEGIRFHASDSPDRPAGAPTDGQPRVGVSLAITGSERGNLDEVFARLAEGGQIKLPLAKQVWGDYFGQLTDKYGVVWMVDFRDPSGEAGTEPEPGS